MRTMCKTPNGTIGAFRWECGTNKGISVGIYGKGNFTSFEYDENNDELVLLVRKNEMEKQGFKLKFVDDNWDELFNMHN